MTSVVLKYKPRKAFQPFHNRRQRFAVLVCHRRAGKTVAAVNEIVSRALYVNTQFRPNPKYAYVAPYRSQAKDIAWTYLKDAVRDIPGTKISESELFVKLPNGATIKLYGADDPDSLRGGYLDGVVLDEYGDMKGTVFSTVVRPMLADRKGWSVFMGSGADSDVNHLNLFNTNTGILQAALYARIPEPDVSRRFRDSTDQVGRVASLILQRALSYELETDHYCDTVFKNVILDRLVAGAGVAWVRYDVETEEGEDFQLQPWHCQVAH